MKTTLHRFHRFASLALVLALILGLGASLSVPAMAAGPRPPAPSCYTVYTVTGTTYYLALRNQARYDHRNEIGKLYNGEQVYVTDASGKTYWYVYAPTLGLYGYVDSRYLTSCSAGYYLGDDVYTVYGTTHYLALRSEPRTNCRNEIGKLYNGETVYVTDASRSDFWYVYAPGLNMYGYVNRDYIRSTGTNELLTGRHQAYEVSGVTYYLALRNAPQYSHSNEIAKLYTGDVVYMNPCEDTAGNYAWVYVPSLDQWGYADARYLQAIYPCCY